MDHSCSKNTLVEAIHLEYNDAIETVDTAQVSSLELLRKIHRRSQTEDTHMQQYHNIKRMHEIGEDD